MLQGQHYFFYEVMAIFYVFYPHPQKNPIYFHLDSNILIMSNLSLSTTLYMHISYKIFFQDPHQLENTRAATDQDADSFALDLLWLLDFLLFL